MERYRFHSDGALFYVTFSVVDWLPIFVSEAACKIVTKSLNFCGRASQTLARIRMLIKEADPEVVEVFEPEGLVLSAQGEALGFRARRKHDPERVVHRRGAHTANGPFRAEWFCRPTFPGLRPGLTESALQAANQLTESALRAEK
jgi:hypothetical protein